MLDKTTAQDFAKKLKIDLFTVYREYLQLLFLKYFYAQKESQDVYFKGGTALRFLFGSFRFSEDLDFTSVVSEKRIYGLIKKTVAELNKEGEEVIFKRTESIAKSFSGRILKIIPEFKLPITVRLDFSLREKPFTKDISYIETIFPIGPYPQVVHFKIEEMLAEKVRAILTRNRGRDIFDLWFMLSKAVKIDWDLVNKKMALYKKTGDLKKLIQVVKMVPQKEIKDDLTRFLPLSHRSLVLNVQGITLEKLRSRGI